MDAKVRKAVPRDAPALVDMVRELARFEHLETTVPATTEDFRKHLFGPASAAEALVAEDSESELVGYAIFYPTFSTFVGKPGLWLEDIFVRESHRGRGVGRSLLRAVARAARERGAGRLEWSVLGWNRRAIDFYEKSGATILEEWSIARVEGRNIEALSEKAV